MKKGDTVVFAIGNGQAQYKVKSDEYEREGRKVVDLHDYDGEVSVEYLSNVK